MKTFVVIQEELEKFCFHMNTLAEVTEKPLERNLVYLMQVTQEIEALLGISLSVMAHPPVQSRLTTKTGTVLVTQKDQDGKPPLVIFPVPVLSEILTLLESYISISTGDISLLTDIKNKIETLLMTRKIGG